MDRCHALYPGDGQLEDKDTFLICRLHDNVWSESSCYNLCLLKSTNISHSLPGLRMVFLSCAVIMTKAFLVGLAICYSTSLQDLGEFNQEVIMAPPEVTTTSLSPYRDIRGT